MLLFLIRNIYLVFHSRHRAPKTLKVSQEKSDKCISCSVNEVTFGKYLRVGAVFPGSQPSDWKVGTFSSPMHPSLESPRWRLNQLPVTSDLISGAYVMEPPIKTHRTGFRERLGW